MLNFEEMSWNLVDRAVDYVAKKYWVWKEEMLSDTRIQEVVKARKELIYILKNRYNYTFQRIGDILWWKHHSWIIYLYKQYINNNNDTNTKKT
jgi:chromosomal replication initiation ATPase DnaA